MANTLKDPVVEVYFGGETRPMRWDYNTLAELQDLGFDMTDEALVKRLSGEKPTLKMLAAFAAAALTSGAEDGREFSTREVGRMVTADGDKSDVFAKVSELMKLAHGEAEPEAPLAETQAA